MDAPELRAEIRAGRFAELTAAAGAGYVQANLLVLPAEHALAFAAFCRRNPRACPLLDVTDPGDPHPPLAAAGADLRTDLPRYRVYRRGELVDEPASIEGLWRDDSVAFLLGCSFSFEQALVDAGVRLWHLEQGRNVAMYRTSLPCRPAGPFRGSVVVSMRPVRSDRVELVREICAGYPLAHGAPVAVGDPGGLGIADLGRPDFGDAAELEPGEVPVFWACGVTSQAAALSARLELVIAHAPGHMFVTDWPHEAARGRGLLLGDGLP